MSDEIVVIDNIEQTVINVSTSGIGPQGPQGPQGPAGGGGDSYTGEAERTVGGISDGDTFTDASMNEMWDALIKEEKFPTLLSPSSSFTASITGYQEVGEVLSITFNSSFNRGSINPQYTAASPYRSGLPNEYQFTGVGITNQSKTDLSDSQTISSYTVLINGQTWQGRVAYDEGVQPKSSYDNDYSSPLAAGNTGYTARSITGVYPYFGTTSDITARTKQPLASHTASYYQFDMVAESGGNKQTAWFSASHATITGVQFYNTVSGSWEWIGGSKANSLAVWTTSTVDISVQGNSISYTKYVHNDSLVGSRQLRFYTT